MTLREAIEAYVRKLELEIQDSEASLAMNLYRDDPETITKVSNTMEKSQEVLEDLKGILEEI